ncbi:MAG TPA: hypothetical protein VFD13_08695 [Candidatus Kapabacteria bacterium]|nr:hypothetical protein [Candidatus Kapabacteria bacterium]
MRCYSDAEVLAITEERVTSVRWKPSVHANESASASPIPEFRDEHSRALHSEMPEMLQFIADLEFETKFAELLHSIAFRWPAFRW